MSLSVAAAAAVAGVGIYAYINRQSAAVQSGRPAFSSFGFHSLKLHSTELVNHNTKRLRFQLPDNSVPSGLGLTSALLTIAFPNGRWVPVLRPYTPVNDLSGFPPLYKNSHGRSDY